MMEAEQVKYREMRFLVCELTDGAITQDGMARLNQILANDRKAVEHYVDFQDIQILIKSILSNNESSFSLPVESELQDLKDLWLQLAEGERTAPAIELPKEKPQRELIQKVVYPPRQKHKMSKFGVMTFIAGAAAALFFAIFLKFAPEPAGSVEVATLADQINVQWAQSSNKLENGSRLWTGDGLMNLQKGIVKIHYDDGVEVLVEGPAIFEIERLGVYMEYGRLYSQVSQVGKGFTVRTPTSQFIDLGTEFGVQADINGSSELHVIKGKVQLFAGGKGQSKSEKMVTQDRAARYDANRGSVESIPVQKEIFARNINSKVGGVWRGQTAIGINFSAIKGASKMAGLSFDGVSNWTDAVGASGGPTPVLGTNGQVTVKWTSHGMWEAGTSAGSEDKLYRAYLDDVGNDSVTVTLTGLRAWLASLGSRSYSVRVYRGTDVSSHVFTDIDILSGGSIIDVIEFPVAVNEILDVGGMRAKNDSGALMADTITLDPQPSIWNKTRATIAGVQIIASSSDISEK